MEKKYYSVSGTAGAGVFTDYNKVQNEMIYAGKYSRCKKFSSYNEANNHARERYSAITGNDMVRQIPLGFLAHRSVLEKIAEKNIPKQYGVATIYNQNINDYDFCAMDSVTCEIPLIYFDNEKGGSLK